MDDEVLRQIGNVLIIYTFVASIGFCVAYHFMARWWETSFGMSLMIYQISMSAVLGLSTLRLITDNGEGWAMIRLLVFIGVPVALTWRLAVLIKLQRDKRRERRGD